MGVQTTLSTCYGWRGQCYGPGPATIPDDLAIALGLSQVKKPEPPPVPIPRAEVTAKADNLDVLKTKRTQELQDLYNSPEGGYRLIKDLSQQYGLGSKAPDGGWDHAIPGIVEHEANNGLLGEGAGPGGN
jgi:hypothetical protein